MYISLSSCLLAKNSAIGSADQNIQRQLRFTLTLTNPKPYELVDQVLWFYLPAAETSTQKLESIKISVPYNQSTDALGHSIIKLSFSTIAPLSSKLVNLVVNMSMKTIPTSIPLDNPKAWLGVERYIEADHPDIQSLAIDLKRPEAIDTGLAIYEWIRQYLHYTGYLADDRGAAYAIKQLAGDCTEYAYLAVALARANGIPARMIGGYVTDKNAILRAVDYHNWAELYIDGAWRLFDAQKEHWLTPTEQYVVFRIHKDQEINPIGLAHRYRLYGEVEVKF